MSLKDIEKLKAKVEKDPNSKLFVPLAEECRKEGLLDDAIKVLLNGLEGQPGYMSARVSLGKVYLEKGMLKEAQTEFENVIKSIPDNLYAHKKLAEIYRDTGEKDLAKKSFRTVLKLNPMDEDALNRLRDIEGKEDAGEPLEESPVGEMPASEEAPSSEEGVKEAAASDTGKEAVSSEETEVKPPHVDEELTVFKNSLFGSTEEAADSVPTEISDQEDKDIEILDEPVEGAEEEISFGDIGEAFETEEPEIKDKSEEITVEDVNEEIFSGDTKLDKDLTEPLDKARDIEDADRHISGGDYIEALNIYKSILSSNRDDKKVLQGIEDLKMLLRLTGKDKEALISRLNIFLDGINKRRNEFFGSS